MRPLLSLVRIPIQSERCTLSGHGGPTAPSTLRKVHEVRSTKPTGTIYEPKIVAGVHLRVNVDVPFACWFAWCCCITLIQFRSLFASLSLSHVPSTVSSSQEGPCRGGASHDVWMRLAALATIGDAVFCAQELTISARRCFSVQLCHLIGVGVCGTCGGNAARVGGKCCGRSLL